MQKNKTLAALPSTARVFAAFNPYRHGSGDPKIAHDAGRMAKSWVRWRKNGKAAVAAQESLTLHTSRNVI